jgi:hypothetical protein
MIDSLWLKLKPTQNKGDQLGISILNWLANSCGDTKFVTATLGLTLVGIVVFIVSWVNRPTV